MDLKIWGLASKGCQTLRNVFMALRQAVLFGNTRSLKLIMFLLHILSPSLSLLSVFDVFGSSTFPVEMEVAGQDLHSQLCS